MSVRANPNAPLRANETDSRLVERAPAAADAVAWVWRADSDQFQLDQRWLENREIDFDARGVSLQDWLRTIHPDDRAALRRQLGRATTTDPIECEYRLARGDDAWLWVLHRGRVIERDATGAPRLALGLLVDIDARKRAESSFAEDQARLATALWGARAAFWQWHVPTDSGTSSAMWFAITGYSREQWESVPHPWTSRLHPDDRARVERHLADHVSGRIDKVEHEYRIKVANGSWKWMLDRGRAIEWDLDGKPTLVMGVSLDIDSAKRAEDELRTVQSRLHTAVWGASAGLWELDFRTGLTHWYNDWCSRHDIDPCDGEDHVARWDDNLHPDEGPEAKRRSAAHVAGDRDYYDADYRIRTRRGDWCWVFERGRVVERDGAGQALRMVGICMDNAERKVANLELLANKERLETALSHSGAGPWELRISTDEANHSDAFYQLFGVTPAVGRADRRFWQNHVHPEDLRPAIDSYKRAAAAGQDAHEVEYRFRHADGSWHWAFDRMSILERNAAGAPERIVGLTVDITDRKSRELALIASDRRFRTAAEAISGIVYEIDLQTGVVERHGVERMLGYTSAELASSVEAWTQICHPDDRERFERDRWAVANTGVAGDATNYRIRHRDGHYLTVSETPVLLRDITGTPARIVGFTVDITQNINERTALADSEALFRTVAALAPGFVFESAFLSDGSSQIVRVSEGFERAMGCDLNEFQRRGHWGGALAESSQAVGRAIYEQLLAGASLVCDELQIRRPDGSARWLAVRSRSVHDQDGRVTGSIGSATDITERRASDEALRRSQAQLMAIAESSPDWLVLVDADMRVQYINHPMMGRAPDALIGCFVRDIAPPEDMDRVAQAVAHVLETGEPADLEQTYGREPARLFDMRIRVVRAGDRVAGAVICATDITARRAADELRATQARILEALREAVAVVNLDNVICIANPSFDAMFGFAPGAAVGASLEPLVVAGAVSQRNRIDRQMREAAGLPHAVPVEFDCLRRDGSAFTANCVATQIVIGDREHWLVAFTDVTERKRMEREVLEIASREQLRIGSDLHDGLGQDLTGIALMMRSVVVQLRKENSAVRADVEDIIGLVNAAIESTRAMARGLSPVGAAGGGLVAGLRSLAARGLERFGVHTNFTTRLEVPLSIDDCSAGHLYRIAQEAFTNSVRHGRVTEVQIDLHTYADGLQLTISDNGRGFDPHTLRGDGMGLKLMRYRAQMLHGDLTVDTSDSGGVAVQCTCSHPRSQVG
ncbi:MAG: PAS domain-containing protein [Pseudomonadales bacterium]|nr:PAS domain-containing protein [Pseudomonadales bacterium]